MSTRFWQVMATSYSSAMPSARLLRRANDPAILAGQLAVRSTQLAVRSTSSCRGLVGLEVRGVHRKAVQALRVVAEDLALQPVRDVLPLHQLVHRLREGAVPVGIAGSAPP